MYEHRLDWKVFLKHPLRRNGVLLMERENPRADLLVKRETRMSLEKEDVPCRITVDGWWESVREIFDLGASPEYHMSSPADHISNRISDWMFAAVLLLLRRVTGRMMEVVVSF